MLRRRRRRDCSGGSVSVVVSRSGCCCFRVWTKRWSIIRDSGQVKEQEEEQQGQGNPFIHSVAVSRVMMGMGVSSGLGQTVQGWVDSG